MPRIRGAASGVVRSAPFGPAGWSSCFASRRPRGAVPTALAFGLLAGALSPALAAPAALATAGAGTPLAWLSPQAQPCAELCDADWALDRMRGAMPQSVHAEFKRRIDAGRPMRHAEVASGDVILAVSYANAGIPHVDLTRRVAKFPDGIQFSAEGHAVTHDGMAYRFVRVQTWDNWALIIDAPRGSASGPASGTTYTGPGHPGAAAGGGDIAGIAGGGGGGGAARGAGPRIPGLDPAPPVTLLPPPTPPMPVPLPGGLALLAGALTLLAAPRLRRAARGQ